MSDYARVQKALSDGAQPEMLCQTCPWDRFCITPPSMSHDEVRAHILDLRASAKRDLSADLGEGTADRLGMIVGTMMHAGDDREAELCPVLAVRLRGPNGNRVIDTLKPFMRSWSD